VAKKNLSAFEASFDEQMPHLQSLSAFREKAKNLLEGANKNRAFAPRTDYEEQELLRKMRKMQADNKEIDMTVLFNTERAERLRKRLHKKAFKTYKNYEFLKAGLVKPNESTQRKDALAPFKKNNFMFPAADRLASELFTDKIYQEAMDYGEALDDRGRRFNGYD